ncbi:hypothetical protein D9M72_322270 [compost metagenome]
MRRVRAVGLVLVDEGRGGVFVHTRLAVDLGGAGQDHEVGRAAFHETRVVRLQRDEDGAVAALGHQVQAVVEELPEEGHPGVEGLREAGVGRGVGNEVHQLVVAGAEQPVQARAGDQGGPIGAGGGRHRRRVVVGLVDDQVADGARVAVHHVGGAVVVGVGNAEEGSLIVLVVELRRQQPREGVVGGAELALVEAGEVQQVVELAGDRPQAHRGAYVGQQGQEVGTIGMGFGDTDLLEDEVQVGAHQSDAGAAAGDRRSRLDRRGGCRRGEGGDSRGGRGEHLFGDAVGILVDALHADRQPSHIRRDAIADAVGTDEGQVAGRHFDYVFEDARTGYPLDLPGVVDVGDATSGIVAIADACGRDGEEVTDLQTTAVDIGNGQRPYGLRVQSGHQNHCLVGELQPLDMGQAVDTVGADVVGHRDDIVGKIIRCAVVVDDDGVVGTVAGEVRGVEIRVTGEQFAHSHQLAGVDGAVQHGRHQGQVGRGAGQDARLVLDHADHAVGAADLVAAGITDADTHVQPQVAIEQVIAAAPFEDIAAAAADDDVAAVEYIVRGSGDAVGPSTGAADEGAQAGNQVEVGQRAAGGAAMVDDVGRIHVVATQDIGECGPRQALHLGEAVEDRRRRLRHRKGDMLADFTNTEEGGQ